MKEFKYAIEGILTCFKEEFHFKIHLVATLLVLIAMVILRFEISDMLWLTLAIFLVLIAEMFNSAIERVVDLVTNEIHPLAKAAKDIAAGAVLLSAVFAVIVGVLVFYGRFLV